MPSVYDSASQHSSCMFCDDFVSADGVSLVVNVLQRDSIPPDVNYSTRQGCYTIALQLLRLLLCGQDITGQIRLTIDQRRASTGSVGAAVGSGSRPPSVEVDPATAGRAIQMMRVADFTDMIACFMRVSWAAAAGKLNLASATPPMRDCNSMTGSWQSNCSTRSRQSSTGSTASSGSETENQSLHAGVCVRQSKVSAKDANIAKEALELLVTCLQLRSHMLSCFYTLPFVADFIIEVLVGSPHSEIRDVALKQFYCLSQTVLTPGESAGHQQNPHHFVLQILLKARLPFWVCSSNTRGASYRLLKQCTQYFKLRCRLLKHLTADDQRHLQLNVVSMLSDEIDWLRNFVTSQNEHVHETDNLLLAGHLTLLNTLLTCDGIDKTLSGEQLVHDLLHDFIFPASKLIMDDSGKDVEKSLVSPKCSTSDCRIAAYDLLLELADGCLENLTAICRELVSMHHQVHPESAKQWEHMPPVTGRSAADFVGLKNGGATCYMNSVLQQLYMTPGVVESVLAVNDEQIEEDSVFCQVQQVFGHLLESQLQFYEPEVFWKVFRLWGQTVNIRDQQDALDFYQAIIDQMDEQLKKIGKELIFKKKFQGVFSDQKICKDCLHRYEREEIFFALNVTVKNATLQDSLDQFVKGELLEGDNAYFCEKCGQKRTAIKRMCIKTLPPHLCIQLKRFDYDWEANRALKFDDHFKFPWVLDMEPYTAEGMARREDESKTKTDTSDSVDNGLVINTCSVSTQIYYELAGVVVHSGQANAGHYYSFIKDRRGSYVSNPNKGKWYKFNDTVVESFEMTDATIEAECFGGRYEVKVYDQSSSFPEERLRYWNAYLLFYEKVEEERGPLSAKKSKVVMWRNPHEKPSMKRNSDSLVELTELVHKGEKRGLFPDRMPAHIQQVVRDKNLRFMKNRDVYDPNYFTFVRKLVSRNMACATEPAYEAMCCESLQLAIKFLLNTYFHTSSRLRDEMEEWQACVSGLVTRCKAACLWLVDFLSSEEGAANFKPLLLECPSKDIRTAFANILEKTISCFFMHGGVATHKNFSGLVENLLRLLAKDVSDNYHNCSQYFHVLNSYVQLGTKACSHMNGRKGFQRLVDFLLGPGPVSSSTDQSVTRKWSSLQAREFGCLHNTLAVLILNCDVSPFRTDNKENFSVRLPQTVTPQIYLKMSAQMQTFVFGTESKRYIREVVLALREVTSGLDNVQDMLLCCSFCNSDFTMAVLKNLMYQYVSAPSNELKGVFSALMELLLLEDVLQLKRLKCVIDGHVDTDDMHYEGLLAVIRSNHVNDSRRSYQSVKFLVTLANKCPVAKDYLLQSSTKWQWAVNWLKTKMSDDWALQPSSTASNEDSNSKSFQRTMSAQDTLDEANALLKELETHSDAEAMDTLSGGDTDHNDDMWTDSPKVEPSKDALDEVDK
ncbi:hypothetical protein NP493_624g01033 [Ridgeia piscesae]|uniref:USP domain-containing protein n=1 Tax=Ridgeia piscesae TaxID=27915 RepID=A0AAD9KSS8_RIDPI|nr:hypothetical protein NP493_624g01033 [Ridgeia piscesae]